LKINWFIVVTAMLPCQWPQQPVYFKNYFRRASRWQPIHGVSLP